MTESTCEYKSPLQMEQNTEEDLPADPSQDADGNKPVTQDQFKAQKPIKVTITRAQRDKQTKAEPVEPEKEADDELETTMEEAVEHFLDITVPPAPMSPYNLVYEALAGEPWKVVMASVLMMSVNSVTCRSMVLDFFDKFPTLESIQKDMLVQFFTVGLIKFGR